MKLPSVIAFACLTMLLISCGGEKKDKKESKTLYKDKKETKAPAAKTVEVPVMLDNKGIGPIKSLKFDDEINQELAARGEQIFNSKCIACHKAREKFLGPPMAGIYKKRSPEWVMNIILNPDQMLKEDPVAKALLKAYNNTVMLNQNIPEEEARAMAEWFRTLE